MSEIYRRNNYKNNQKDFETTRRNRNDHSVELRKVKKEDQLQKRRNIVIDDLADENEGPSQENVKPTKRIDINRIPKMLKSNNIGEILEAVTSCRIQLSKEKNPPIEEFYKVGTIPLLVKILSDHENDTLIFEAAWALTNIASGESKHAAAVVDAGAIPVFIKLMSHSSEQVCEQSIWALSNIAGDGPKYRDLVVKHDIFAVVKNCILRFWSKLVILRHLCWLISNLCRHKSSNYPTREVIDLLPIIREMIVKVNDTACNVDLTWALSFAVDARTEIIDSFIATDLVPVVIDQMSRPEDVLVTASLRTIGNVIAGTNEQAEAAIKCGVIIATGHLLGHKNSRIIKESCWVLSNITAGTEEQIDACMDCNVMAPLLEVLKNGEFRCQKEAVWAISNMAVSSKEAHRLHLLNLNAFDGIVPLLTCDDTKMVIQLLETIRELFSTADHLGELAQCVEVFESVGGVDVIESLQNHESIEIYNRSYDIVKEFLNGHEDDEEGEEQGLEEITENQQFAF